jgi:methylated-DNA-[protein]-cysteine S-methyltransferase
MTLQIIWSEASDGECRREVMTIWPDVGLFLLWQGEVLLESGWMMRTPTDQLPLSARALTIQAYLRGDSGDELVLKLRRPQSVFRQRVWQALAQIPGGSLCSYTELSARLNSAPRAVAGACRDNPFAGLIPCHRVVAKNGIGGFMGQTQGDWIAFKRRILSCEQAL